MTERNSETSSPSDNRWYVAKTRPNAEACATFHLERQGFEVYLPKLLRRIKHARRTSWQPRPLFPSYLFVAMSAAQQRWRVINSTIGVAHLICDDRGPVPVPQGIVDDLRTGEDERGLLLTGRKTPFEKNTAVEIMSGPFADHVGRFVGANDDERVVILMDLLGRQVTAEV
ncbi:MAG: transcriptional activator RfaH, partial [Pseudomonadota bacterium]|nr:transcriptional activator RfaH [Pseudomonadota bacterium]